MQQTLIPIDNQKNLSDYYFSSGSLRVLTGNFIENETRKILNLNKDIYFSSYSPDILDFNKMIIGEIKSCSTGKIFLWVEQILKYIELRNKLNQIHYLDGIKRNFELYYFISCNDGEKIDEIIKINENQLLYLLKFYNHKSSKWYFGNEYIEQSIRLLKIDLELFNRIY